jgi:hypothetical protein
MTSEGTVRGSVARNGRVAAFAVAATREQRVEQVRLAAARLASSRASVATRLRPRVSKLRPSSIRVQVPKPY